MLSAKWIVQVGFVLCLAWVARPSRGDDGGGLDAAREQARVCHEKEAALRPDFDESVSEHNACRKSSECAILTPGCPFGCYVGVRNSDLAIVQTRAHDLASQLGSDCGCMYKCSPPPEASCVHGRCTTRSRP
jgi:hypothetical protein